MDKEYLKTHYIDLKKSIPEISLESPYAKSTIRYWLKKYGLLRTIEEARVICRPKMGVKLRGRKHPHSEEMKLKMKEAAIRRWEGKAKGITKKPDGYIEFTTGSNKYKGQHRVIMEQHLGRKLSKNEVVHHINGVKDDNRIENLQVLSPSEHSRHHAYERVENGTNYPIETQSRRGENHRKAILTQEQVDEIMTNYQHKVRGYKKMICQKYGVSMSCIGHIMAGHNWKQTDKK